jgi:hypothetical protein
MKILNNIIELFYKILKKIFTFIYINNINSKFISSILFNSTIINKVKEYAIK